MSKNDSFLRALRREPVARVPVWLMRQAGRYLPEYRATRERAGSFLALAQQPELACEVTLQPLDRFDLDAAILFSDILTIPDAFGLGLHFVDGEGPRFKRRIDSAQDVMNLPNPVVVDKLRYVYDAVSLIRSELKERVPLIGFSGAPWTLYCYMLEGAGSSNYHRAKKFMWDEPKAAHELLSKLSDAVIEYLVLQAQAGAQALMLFDSWAGLLAPGNYQEFSHRYLQKITTAVKAHSACKDIPLIVFAKGANAHLADLSKIGADALGLDWTVPISQARIITEHRVALQGNLDPAAMYAKPEQIEAEVAMLLEDAGTAPGHIFNLGHGMNPDMRPEHAKCVIDAVHRYSIAQRARQNLV
jgi:uroporphyrinogen decarboxylase